jgi:hypothetical protein
VRAGSFAEATRRETSWRSVVDDDVVVVVVGRQETMVAVKMFE